MIREHCEPILSHAAVMCQIHEKLVKGELWAEVTGVTIWGHIKILPGMCQVIWDHILFGCHISFCCFFALEVMRGHDFWTPLKMSVVIFDLLPPILVLYFDSREQNLA